MTAPVVQAGFVIWITGLSGVGKTTVGKRVVDRLRGRGLSVVHLDGDDIRATLPPEMNGYARADRLNLAGHYAGLAALICGQGHGVVVSTVSLFHSIHERNRIVFARYLEVLLTATPDVLRRRDARGVYRTLPDKPVVGFEIAPEMPTASDVLHIDSGTVPPDACADRIITVFLDGH